MTFPSSLTSLAPRPREFFYMADTQHARLEENIKEYQDKLPDDEQALVTVILHGGQHVTVTWLGYHNASMLIADGIDERGNEVSLLLPHLDTQVVLTKAKKEAGEERRPLGFQPRPAEPDEPE